MTTRVLLTRDEAIGLFSESAFPLADTWTGTAHRLARHLVGVGSTAGLDPLTRERVRHHHRIVGLIIRAGYDDIIVDEADGILEQALVAV
jgi:hypothetical protein